VASAVVRYLAAATPILASVMAAWLLSRVLPSPSAGPQLVGWWLAILTVSTLTLLAVDRMARRLLPLAVLLNLSMVFPDKAPDRFWIAFRAGTIRNLEQRLADAQLLGSEDEPAKAAANIITLVAAITAHDRRTRGHSERVRAFNDLIAEEMHLPEPDRERLRWAALLHDVGKINTPVSILNKPGPLSDAEWRELHRHPENGARITAPLHEWLGPWAATIEQHHERWDGRGYPNGLAADDISLGARIVAVADAYDVMTSPRPYRRAMGARAAREELAGGAAGSQFDPAVVRAFLTVSLGRLRRIAGPIAWLLQFPILASMSRVEAAVAVLGRQLMIMAGTATTVGVLATSGIIDAPPSSDTPPAVVSDSRTGVERTSASNGKAVPNPAEPSPAPGAAVPPSPPAPVSIQPPATSPPSEPKVGQTQPPKTPVSVVPPAVIRVPTLPPPLPPVELPPVQVPGVDAPPTGNPADGLLNPGSSPSR
jgi:putative nucleotidyltransferase with HDIG domain